MKSRSLHLGYIACCGFKLSEIERTADFLTAASLAAAGFGLVLAPASLVKLNLDCLVFRDISDFDENVSTTLIHRPDAPRMALEHLLAQYAYGGTSGNLPSQNQHNVNPEASHRVTYNGAN